MKKLISKSIQKISDNSEFQDSILKPQSDFYKEDFFKISFSPAINFKIKKPRFFEKLTDSIIDYNTENENESKLLNLLIRNPDIEHNNSYPKSNYFIDDLYENHKENANSLNAEEDFSVFFPLPYNNEQKQIYENYLKNRLTVVTGPPGTGKSHTIVNILCSLLAQGKRVLVTAQTDKALESLLDKIPETFDDLIFTKIELETNKNRFSLENSISKISSILTDNFYLNIESKIKDLNNLKSDYVNLKSKIINALEKEYNEITINETFSNLRAYQIVDKIEKKDSKEWNWIKDNLSREQLNDFDKLKNSISNYKKYQNLNTNYIQIVDFDLNEIYKQLKTYNFFEFLEIKKNIDRLSNNLEIKEDLKVKFLSIDLSKIIETLSTYSNVEIVLKKQNDIDVLLNKIKQIPQIGKITTNVTFSDIVNNETKYLLDIETYFSFISDEKVGFFKRLESKFKKVSYLEDITINGVKTNTKRSITKLKEFIETICLINKNFNLLKTSGYSFEYDDKADIESKLEILKETISKVERNNEIVKKIQSETNIIEFSKFVNIDKFEIEELTEKAIECEDDFEKLKKFEFQFKSLYNSLAEISLILENSKIKKDFENLLPIQEIADKDVFENLFVKLEEINNQLNLEKQFIDSIDYLKVVLPLTFEKINEISFEFITKENFEFANANSYLITNEFIDIQNTKEFLSKINEKIYKTKCEILFDLAKDNFRNKFDENEINDYINLLNQYKYNLSESERTLKEKTKYQILTRKNSIAISKKLSCWVMKFNDVLNSVGSEPEIFDCIIVDEASQLDFNSLLLGYYTENMIIVGDDKQTSPTSLTGVDGDSFISIKNEHLSFLKDEIIHIKSDNSLFSLAKMIAGTANLQLKEHFRCVPELIEFSKFNFYNNTLRPLKQINGNRLPPKIPVFIDGAFTEEQIVSREIEQIKSYLKNILTDDKYSNKTIGVVSLGSSKHTEKLKDIKEELANEFGKEKIDKHKLIIEDSPKFQGDERDVMLVSLGVALDFEKLNKNENAKPRAIIQENGDDSRKINVALSRAKEQMILFHSVKTEHLSSKDFRNRILNFFYEEVKPIGELKLDYSNEIRNLHNTPTPFDSWFEYDIAIELIGKGFSYIEPQYKVKEDETYYNHKTNKQSYVNFKLDLVVHNNGKRVAIECDGDPFHSLPVDVAYDIERQEFLERVGWKVYRILYSAYKRNPSNEIEKMINFITKNTKKDEVKLFIPSVKENIIEEIDYDEFENEEENNSRIPIENSNKTYQHKSFIDLMQDEIIETENNLFTIKENENIEDKILRYFNLFENGTYKLQENPEDFCLHSLPISKKYRNGYLLQCYDNGHINKVYVKTLLDKRIDYNYSNGKNPNAKIQYLKLIEDDTIIGLKFNKGKEIIFKAHKTENISNREQLHLQGYKVIYQSFENIEYKVFPKNISDEINRLTYESFNANGKQTNNKNYENEWNIIQKFIPNITEK
ncbi:AAA domain-containing protein [Flavobacterium sp. 83]|uniref:AAA domain-containing protein n=1 Tax=Flavobacterium sp. 83 TaxID=1131812 RepID=UPI000558B74E|nr:AAA domain-containing protein [Flavobacterium sp. 83]